MNTVHSQMLGVSITGNIVTFHNRSADFVVAALASRNQVNTLRTENGYEVSHPMNEEDHRTFAGLIHRLNTQNKLGQNRNPDDDGGGPTPPTGGTPGAAKQELFEHVRAMAA
jgi:hypothetical protein